VKLASVMSLTDEKKDDEHSTETVFKTSMDGHLRHSLEGLLDLWNNSPEDVLHQDVVQCSDETLMRRMMEQCRRTSDGVVQLCKSLRERLDKIAEPSQRAIAERLTLEKATREAKEAVRRDQRAANRDQKRSHSGPSAAQDTGAGSNAKTKKKQRSKKAAVDKTLLEIDVEEETADKKRTKKTPEATSKSADVRDSRDTCDKTQSPAGALVSESMVGKKPSDEVVFAASKGGVESGMSNKELKSAPDDDAVDAAPLPSAAPIAQHTQVPTTPVVSTSGKRKVMSSTSSEQSSPKKRKIAVQGPTAAAKRSSARLSQDDGLGESSQDTDDTSEDDEKETPKANKVATTNNGKREKAKRKPLTSVVPDSFAKNNGIRMQMRRGGTNVTLGLA
jgi:hypothetical protein